MTSTLSFTERATLSQSAILARLLRLMDEKKTNLALSVDVTQAQHLLDLAEMLGPHLCVLKTHIDIVEDFTPTLIDDLVKLAERHQFLLFEDRKFADIGNTVMHQYQGGIYRIADWAHITNAHIIPGPGIIQGLRQVGMPLGRGLLLIAELSSAGHFMDESDRENALQLAKANSDYVMGFVTQRALSGDPKWINFTPGVQLETGKDAFGQQYITPELAIETNGADVIIVGRGIIKANDPFAAAQIYRERGFQAYQRRCRRAA
ncbi:MAG: orotidine-5'-phosphate decarboxylase [Gammaproteobacteria bacterium]|nr:orotidine-5'-phosphate decarboxylase [Gammaproteobacteria bacterium]